MAELLVEVSLGKEICSQPLHGLHPPEMAEAVREAMSGTAPSLPVISSALMAVALGRGGKKLSDSSKTSSKFLGVPNRALPPPTTYAPQEFRECCGAKGSSLGPRSAHIFIPVPREGRDSGPWGCLSSRDPGPALTSISLSDWGDPSKMVTPPRQNPAGSGWMSWVWASGHWSSAWDVGTGGTPDSRMITGKWVLRE